MLLICPVRPGDSNEELRYAMRSWEDNLHLGSDLELWTVGYKPTWVNPDRHIEGNRYKSMPLAVFDNVLLGAQEAVGANWPEDVLYMNDDFFCMEPTGAVLPVRRDVTLAQHLAQFPKGATLWWPRSLRLTADWLAGEGFPHPDSYEVHRPLVSRPDAMLEALSRWVDHAGGRLSDMVPQWRTVYGTLAKVDAYPVKDAKLGLSTPGVGSSWISTSDQNWRRYAATMRVRFQKPSRWENDA